MFQTTILEVAIGMIFLFLLISLLATAVQEALAGRMNMRGNLLVTALQNMIGHDLANKVLENPLINYLGEGKKRPPSYIDKQVFARAVLSQLKGFTGLPDEHNSVKQKLNTIADSNLKAVVATMGAKTMEELEPQLAQWFESTMGRVSGQYRRLIQRNLFWMGVTLAVVLNADAISVFKTLSTNEEARLAVVEQAVRFVEEHPDGSDSLVVAARHLLQKEMDRGNEGLKQTLGIGWYKQALLEEWNALDAWWSYPLWIIMKLAGWAITAYAVTLGAPFWFDLLKKATQIRNTGVKPEEKKA